MMDKRTKEDFERERKNQVSGVRSGLEFTMGVVFIVIGIVIVYKFRGDIAVTAFGVLAIIYGIWRLYKNFRKKN